MTAKSSGNRSDIGVLSNFVCETSLIDEVPSGFNLNDDLSTISVDTESLDSIVTDPDINLCVIITKRVLQPKGLQPLLYNKYLCAGSRSSNVAFETWSR